MPYVKSIPVRSTVHKTLSYILNPDKTEGLLYTSSMNCMTSARDAYLEMKSVFESFSSERYDAPLPLRGKGTVKAIHYIQSFDPNLLLFKSHIAVCCEYYSSQLEVRSMSGKSAVLSPAACGETPCRCGS